MFYQNTAVRSAPEIVMNVMDEETDNNLRLRRSVEDQNSSTGKSEVFPDSLTINPQNGTSTTGINAAVSTDNHTMFAEGGCLKEEVEGKVREKASENEDPNATQFSLRLLSYHQLPKWLQHNEFLTYGHRQPLNSFSRSIKTMFRMHTETWNIWTHFLGFIFFVALCLGIYVYGDYITFLFEDIEVYKLPATDQAMFFCYFLAVMTGLFCSAMFHLFSNHSHVIYKVFSRLDYTGIAIAFVGCAIPATYYGLYCNTTARYIHIAMLGLLSLLAIVISLWSKFSTPKYRPMRFAVFVLLGLYGFVPGVHVCLIEGFFEEHTTSGIHWWVAGLLCTGSISIIGAIFYVSRAPERFFPGRFNMHGSSHQIWHCCSLLGFIIHYNTLLSMAKYRLTEGEACDG